MLHSVWPDRITLSHSSDAGTDPAGTAKPPTSSRSSTGWVKSTAFGPRRRVVGARCPVHHRCLSNSRCSRFKSGRGCQYGERPRRSGYGLQNRTGGFDSRSRIQCLRSEPMEGQQVSKPPILVRAQSSAPEIRMVGREERQRRAKAPKPTGCAGSSPAPSAIDCGLGSWNRVRHPLPPIPI